MTERTAATDRQVSIVIATADRPQIVLDCVRCFGEQVPADVEVVVVDAGLDAPVDETALRLLWPDVRMVRFAQRNAGLQRNEGVRQARGAIIVFLDDDCFVQPGWWPAVVEPLLRDEGGRLKAAEILHPSFPIPHPFRIGAVAGAVWVNPSPKLTNRRGGYVNMLGEPVQVTHRGSGAPRDVDWPLTTNMAVLKCVMEQIGGFCPAYGIYDEDVDLGLKIRRFGWRIVFQPEAAVYHYFLKRPPKPVTKRSEFRLGRNRSMLLVRNYGFSVRLVLFLFTGPFVHLWQATVRAACASLTAYGHGLAYVAGMIAGIIYGYRNSISKDRL